MTLPFFMALRKQQIKWIYSDDDLYSMYLHYIKFYTSLPSSAITTEIYVLICIVLTKGVKYKKYIKPKDVYEKNLPSWQKVASEVSVITAACERKNIKCGNMKCSKNYMLDKYGIDMNIPRDHPDPKTKISLNLWRKRIVIKKWHICKGCKTTYYCSRKCQKLSWNRYGHRNQCKQLQTLIT